jgi:hypothetical protein
MPTVLVWVALILMAGGIPDKALGEEAEHDVCTCKVTQKGAESSLRGGVCQRTEAKNCLMEWGSTSRGRVQVGNGESQVDSAVKAEKLIKQGVGDTFRIPALASQSSDLPQLQIAILNLSRLPPSSYEKDGMLESFVLVAATALVRFEVKVDVLAKEMLGPRRKELIIALRDGGGFKIELADVRGSVGCLQFDIQKEFQVYIKTPYASTERC